GRNSGRARCASSRERPAFIPNATRMTCSGSVVVSFMGAVCCSVVMVRGFPSVVVWWWWGSAELDGQADQLRGGRLGDGDGVVRVPVLAAGAGVGEQVSLLPCLAGVV